MQKAAARVPTRSIKVDHHPDLLGRQAQVRFQSLESELTLEKQQAVIIRHISGNYSQKTAGSCSNSLFATAFHWSDFKALNWTVTYIIYLFIYLFIYSCLS